MDLTLNWKFPYPTVELLDLKDIITFIETEKHQEKCFYKN